MPALTDLLGRTYRGYTGSRGDIGIQGIQGITGIQGIQGLTGTTAYDFSVVSLDTPVGGSVLSKVIFPRTTTIAQNFAGSIGDVDTNPTTDPYVIDVTKNNASVGNISISSNGEFSFSSSNSIVLSSGDILEFIAPTPVVPESSLTGLTITIVGQI